MSTFRIANTVRCLAALLVLSGCAAGGTAAPPRPEAVATALRATVSRVLTAVDPSGAAPEISGRGLGSCGGADGLGQANADTWLTVYSASELTDATADPVGDAIVTAFSDAGWKVTRDVLDSDTQARTISADGPDESTGVIFVQPGSKVEVDAKTGCFPR